MNQTKFLTNQNNYIYQLKTRTGKLQKKLLGIKCPHCGYFMAENKNYEDWSIDAHEHITYCNPAHKRAEYSEEY
jgi:uncharacterized C2H2 Zn-finger protein